MGKAMSLSPSPPSLAPRPAAVRVLLPIAPGFSARGLRRPTGWGRSRTGGACSPTRSSSGCSPTSRRRIMRSTSQRRRRSRKGMGATSRRISFQEYKNKLLEPGLVDHIVVSNKSVAKVYVRSSPSTNQSQDSDIHITTSHLPGREAPSRYKYYFNIGSVDSFEGELEEAQEALGVDPHDYVPVTYAAEVNWFEEMLKFAPTVFIIGLIYFMGKRLQSGFSIGGPGKGGHGIFNMGKAQVTKTDKNSKNKVFFKNVAGCDEANRKSWNLFIS